MVDELFLFQEKPTAEYLIVGWRRQWANGGRISSGLPRYLIEKLGAKEIGELGPHVSTMCYPFQAAGTHDAFRPVAAFRDGLPADPMHRENYFHDAGNGLIIFLGEEPWFRLDLSGIPQIKPPFLDIAPSGIPPNIIPHSKSVKCGLMRPDSLKFPAFMGQPLYCQA